MKHSDIKIATAVSQQTIKKMAEILKIHLQGFGGLSGLVSDRCRNASAVEPQMETKTGSPCGTHILFCQVVRGRSLQHHRKTTSTCDC